MTLFPGLLIYIHKAFLTTMRRHGSWSKWHCFSAKKIARLLSIHWLLNPDLAASHRSLQEIQSFLQQRTLKLLADLISRASGRKILLVEAKGWTVGEYMTVHYQVKALRPHQDRTCTSVKRNIWMIKTLKSKDASLMRNPS